MKRLFTSITLLVALGLIFSVACSSEAEVIVEEKIVEVEKEVIKEVEVASSPGKLVIYSGRKESLVGPIIEQFKAASGIEVEVKYGSTGEIAATLLEEGKNSPADVFFAQDPGLSLIHI